MRIFDTYLYEISKGTKPAALVTIEEEKIDRAIKKLEKAGLSFVLQKLSNSKVNLFFGSKECIETIKTFLKPLCALNPYEDFILGTILGYDPKVQCKRFLTKI